MENIRNFVETIKGIKTTQIIDIGIAILIYILFRCLSRSLAYMTVKIFKPKTRNKMLTKLFFILNPYTKSFFENILYPNTANTSPNKTGYKIENNTNAH